MANGVSAWLVTWEYSGEAAETADKVAAILSGRTSDKTVAEFVELLYALRTSTAGELASYSRNPKNNPYRSTDGMVINEVPHGDRIRCGHHPWLYARRVKDLLVKKDVASGFETISWIEPPQFRWSADRSSIVEAVPEVRQSVTRTRSGALSDELVWNRATGSRKPAFPGDDV